MKKKATEKIPNDDCNVEISSKGQINQKNAFII